MTITVTFPEPTERALRAKAAEQGQEVGEFVRELVERQIGLASQVAERQQMMLDALKPFWDAAAQSGLSDEEELALIEEVRNEVWNERHARTLPP